MCLVFYSLLYMMFYIHLWPQVDKYSVWMEIFNESLFMFLNYYMITFTQFNLTIERHFDMGFVYLYTIGVIILVNVIHVIAKIKRRRKKTSKLRRLKTMNE